MLKVAVGPQLNKLKSKSEFNILIISTSDDSGNLREPDGGAQLLDKAEAVRGRAYRVCLPYFQGLSAANID